MSSGDRTGAPATAIPATTVWLRVVAIIEALKGIVVLCAGTGILVLVHQDVQSLAARLIEHFHLDPAHHIPGIFLKVATGATPGRGLPPWWL